MCVCMYHTHDNACTRGLSLRRKKDMFHPIELHGNVPAREAQQDSRVRRPISQSRQCGKWDKASATIDANTGETCRISLTSCFSHSLKTHQAQNIKHRAPSSRSRGLGLHAPNLLSQPSGWSYKYDCCEEGSVVLLCYDITVLRTESTQKARHSG